MNITLSIGKHDKTTLRGGVRVAKMPALKLLCAYCAMKALFHCDHKGCLVVMCKKHTQADGNGRDFCRVHKVNP